MIGAQLGQPIDRLLGFGQVALGATLQQRLDQNAGAPNAVEGPSCLVQSSTALRITGIAASRSPRLAPSRAASKSVTGTMAKNPLAQKEITGPHH